MIRVLFCLIISLLLCSCGVLDPELKRDNINIFKNTEAWELAVAVRFEDVIGIGTEAEKNPDLLNFQDPYHDITLLMWAIGMEKYKSVEALLKRGADPNIIAAETEMTALSVSAGYSWVNKETQIDPKYTELLLEYGADPIIAP